MKLQIEDHANGIIRFWAEEELCKENNLDSCFSLTCGTDSRTSRVAEDKDHLFHLTNISEAKVYLYKENYVVETQTMKILIESKILGDCFISSGGVCMSGFHQCNVLDKNANLEDISSSKEQMKTVIIPEEPFYPKDRRLEVHTSNQIINGIHCE